MASLRRRAAARLFIEELGCLTTHRLLLASVSGLARSVAVRFSRTDHPLAERDRSFQLTLYAAPNHLTYII